MHKLTNKQYEAYMKMLREKEEGRLLTPDGLRLICSANEYDPEKIGLHMLAVYAGIAENPRVVEDYVRYLTFRMGKEAD